MADSFSAKQTTGLVQISKAAVPEAQEYSQQDIDEAIRVFGALGSRPDLIPTTFLAYLQDYFSSADPLTLTTNSLLDFSRFTVQSSDFIAVQESRSATAYGDMTNVGPTIASLPSGRYLFITNCLSSVSGGSAGDSAYMSLSVNGVAADDLNAAQNQSSSGVAVEGFSLQTLSLGSNTVVAKYRVDTSTGGVAKFSRRKMLALRYANL